jgi:hypothetical protein
VHSYAIIDIERRMLVNYEERELYEYIKARYDEYRRDPVRHNLVAFVLHDDQVDTLAGVGYKTGGTILKAEVPSVLKALSSSDKVDEMSLF